MTDPVNDSNKESEDSPSVVQGSEVQTPAKNSENDEHVAKILEEYEILFKDRFTEKDLDFQKTLQNPLSDPPCVENWYSKPKRSWDWSRDRGRGRGGGRGYDNHRGRGQWRGHRRDDRSHHRGYHGGQNRDYHGGQNRDYHGSQNRDYHGGQNRDHHRDDRGPSRSFYAGMKRPNDGRDNYRHSHHHGDRHHPYGGNR